MWTIKWKEEIKQREQEKIGEISLSNQNKKKDKGKIEDKREREKKVVGEMIALYCRKNHKNGQGQTLCPECEELKAYATLRSDKCPFMETKTFCSNCKVHCYQPAMREKIRQVMRFSGPRMLLYHPIMATQHVIESKREKHRLEKQA